jgi:cation:H+ antiporter
MLVEISLILVSLVLLYFGAEWLVKGGASLALRLGLTPVVVGLTVVAFGTSAPEMVVSVKAAWAGQGDLAIGNVVGSNIFNVGIILGVAALVCPLRVQLQLLKVDGPILVAVSLLLLLLFSDRRIDRWEAGVFLLLLVIYTVGNVWQARRQTSAAVAVEYSEGVPGETRGLRPDLGLILGGLAVLIVGSRLLVDNSVSLARGMGVSEAVIGLTIVAAGTSMPELATSIVAALKRQPDIAIGNVIGSNIFNILGILGVAGLIRPMEGTGILPRDLYLTMALSVALLPLLWSGLKVSRWEGGVLIAVYLGYLFALWPR